jgi:hypothetical protein
MYNLLRDIIAAKIINMAILNVATNDDLALLRKQLLEDLSKMLNENKISAYKKWVRTSDVEEMLGLSASSVQNLRTSGALGFSKINGTIFYKLEDIEKLLENNHNHSKNQKL